MASATTRRPALTHHSYANVHEVSFQHLHWVVTIDFHSQQLTGSAEYTFTYLPPPAPLSSTATTAIDTKQPELVLDTRHLSIEEVLVDGKRVDFELLSSDDVFGSALVVPIAAHSKKVKVQYATTSQSSGLQWLPKELTAGRTHPFLFTQCQAIHARSIVPAPDTPSAKFTYTAHVTVPEWATVLLSAIADESAKHQPRSPNQSAINGDVTASVPVKGTRIVRFHQEVPIPSYLLAIAAGRLESAELGPRSRVWAEPTVVGRAAHEFAQTEAFLKHAEEITGQEYVWKRYDLVCLPPSFPYGGMENPCLTFVTPTLLAGDRSLADVVAHEIAHSWTGNLVTNHTWRDFWLNEGWTMWLERKIQTRIYKDPLAYDLKASMGLRALVEAVERFGHSHPYTHLVPDMTDQVDPDEVFSSIPYEKGFSLLHYLMTVVGGHETFDAFARAYIREFRFKTVTSQQFKDFFIAYFTDTVDKHEEIKQIEWEKWYHAPGMPSVVTKFDTTLSSQAIALAEQILASPADPQTWTSASSTALKEWPATLWILLLDTLLLKQAELAKHTTKARASFKLFSPAHLDAIDAFCQHHLTTTQNAELRFRWYTLSLRALDSRLLPTIKKFLKEQGRMKYVRPLYRDLCTAVGYVKAANIFDQSKGLYHPIAVKMVQRDIEEAKASVQSAVHKIERRSAHSGGKGVSATLAAWMGMSEENADYAPLAALALTAAVVGTAVVVVVRRRR
ncbi:Leukotriene a-4 hydrolase/aminopeptidase [Globisporangium polare]